MLPVAVVAIAYLLGSIPFGYLLVRLSKGEDVRASGSGGTGATNVARRAGKRIGVLTLVLDALKGMLAVALARWLLPPDTDAYWWTVAGAGVAVVVGHVFPVWLRFRGGKGVATGLGVFLYLAPLAVASALLIFLLIVWKTRYVSLGSVGAAALLPLTVWMWSSRTPETSMIAPLTTAAIIGSLLIIFMHRANIARLMKGTENKLK